MSHPTNIFVGTGGLGKNYPTNKKMDPTNKSTLQIKIAKDYKPPSRMDMDALPTLQINSVKKAPSVVAWLGVPYKYEKCPYKCKKHKYIY